MLSPIREPIYAATARTLSGSLAEMERVIGDALFAGYVGYNGRSPGAVVKKDKEDAPDNTDRNKLGGDARHTLVAYFEIVELASILFVDRETVNLAIRIFRHTASTTSLRNRNVESLATAAFAAAAERRYWEYEQWLKTKPKQPTEQEVFLVDQKDSVDDVNSAMTSTFSAEGSSSSRLEWPVPPRNITLEEIAMAANLDAKEIQRNLRVVNTAMRKHRPENSPSLSSHMPALCKRVDLPERTKRLAMDIAEKTTKLGICPRRNPVSISAAAIYLACLLDGVRKTQMEICKATIPGLTEVTLRKVYKELNQKRQELIPDWYTKHASDGTRADVTGSQGGAFTKKDSASNVNESPRDEMHVENGTEEGRGDQDGNEPVIPSSSLVPPPLPPPLPPGIDTKAPASQSTEAIADKETQTSGSGLALAPIPASTGEPSASLSPTKPDNNPLLAMINNPAMQAFASALSIMPQMMMPPPPPPLPPPPLPPPLPPSVEPSSDEQTAITKTGMGKENVGQSIEMSSEPSLRKTATNEHTTAASGTDTATTSKRNVRTSMVPGNETESSIKVSDKANGTEQNAPPVTKNEATTSQPANTKATGVKGEQEHKNGTVGTSANISHLTAMMNRSEASAMAGIQSMMGMMQMMQAFQNMQNQMGANSDGQGGNGSIPFAMMAAMMSQMQNMTQNPAPNASEPMATRAEGDKETQSQSAEAQTTTEVPEKDGL